jgi:hypothetical protein
MTRFDCNLHCHVLNFSEELRYDPFVAMPTPPANTVRLKLVATPEKFSSPLPFVVLEIEITFCIDTRISP